MKIKKYYKLIASFICFTALVFLLVGCTKKVDSVSSAVNIEKQDLSSLSDDEIINKTKNANQTTALLNKYKLFGASIEHYNYQGQDSWTEGFTFSSVGGKINGSYMSGAENILEFESDKFYRYDSKANTFSQLIFFKNQYEEAKSSIQKCYQFLSEPTEKVVSIKRTDDCILINTEYNAADNSDRFKKDYSISDGTVKTTYTVNPNTFFIEEKTATCLLHDKTEKELFDTFCQTSEGAKKAIKSSTLMIENILTKEERNFTVIFEPETDNKTKKTYKVKSGLKVVFDLPVGYNNVYQDEACTKIYHSEAIKNDETIYLKQGK